MKESTTITATIDNFVLAKLEARAKQAGFSSVEEYISVFFDTEG